MSLKCPSGHELPHAENGLSCAPDFCGTQHLAAQPKRRGRPPKPPPAASLPIDHKVARDITREVKKGVVAATTEFLDTALEGTELAWAAKADAEQTRAEEIAKLGRAVGRYEARAVYTKTPRGLTGEEARDWAEKKLPELIPDAVARIEFDLKLGDDDVSRKAAYEVLDRTGFGRKDGGNVVGAPIIIVNQAGESKQYRPAFMIDAEVVEKK